MEEVQEERLKYHEVIGGKIKIKIDTRAELLKSKYGVYGHATVELCHWTKSALSGGPSCYKYKFYGAPVGGSHRCVEFGPMGIGAYTAGDRRMPLIQLPQAAMR